MAETGNQRDLTKGEKTKYRLARAMKECMKSTSVENITVKQITEECGLTRQTFYRNFLDKYDLINWYFDKLLVKSFEHMGQGKTVYDALVKKFTYIQTQEEYRKAAIDAVRKLSVDVGIPTKLEAIKEEVFSSLQNLHTLMHAHRATRKMQVWKI
ncbi:MAG: hypothetical protein V8Q86_11130 [Blautia sp.]